MKHLSEGHLNYTPPATSPLNYAPSTLRQRRRRGRRNGVLLILVFVALLTAVAFFGQEVVDQVRMLMLQQTAARYTAPAGQIVLEREPMAADKLIHGSAYIPIDSGRYAWGARPVQQNLWDYLACFSGWQQRMEADHDTDEFPLLFCGTRHCAAGKDRIVMVEGDLTSDGQLYCFNYVVIPAGWFGWPVGLVSQWPPHPAKSARFLNRFADARIFAGRADPNNSATFSIEYEILGVRHRVTGEVKADESIAYSQDSGTPVPLSPTPASAP
jgi:hypothetical protein